MKDRTFENLTIEWFNDYVNEHEDDTKLLEDLAKTLDVQPEDGQTLLDALLDYDDADTIYEKVVGKDFKDVLDKEEFLANIFCVAAEDFCKHYSFADGFIGDMAYNAQDAPKSFFMDLSQGGCASGTVSSLIYNEDCKKIYVDNIDDMETFIGELEDEMGEKFQNKDNLPRYTFVCWLCYEELGYRIANTLFPEDF